MPTSIRLEKDLEARLDRLSKQTGRTKAYYLREIIANGIEDMEDYYLASEIRERIRRGDEDVVPVETLYREFGLEGK